MAAWWDGVDLTVEIAFASDPLDDTPSWTDVSDYARGADGRSLSISRGRSDEYSTFSPGTMSITLDNRDRRFDPNHDAGPYFGNLLPMKQIRVTATYDSTTYPVYYGFVTGWPQSYRSHFDSTVTINCIDAMRFLGNAQLAESAYHLAVLNDSPVHYWPLQEQNTTASAQWVDVVDGKILYQAIYPDMPISGPATTEGHAPQGAGWLATAGAGEANDAAVVGGIVSPGRISVQPYGLEAWITIGSRSTASLPRVEVYGPAGVSESVIGFWNDAGVLNVSQYDGVIDLGTAESTDVTTPSGLHHIAVWSDGTEIFLYVDGTLRWSRPILALGYSPGETNGVRIYSGWSALTPALTGLSYFSHVAVYGAGSEPDWAGHYLAGVTAFGHPYGERGGARIGRVLDEIDWPAAWRTLSTGDTYHGPYLPAAQLAMDYLRSVETAEAGFVFVGADGAVTFRDRTWQWTTEVTAEFSDDGVDLPFTDVVIDANTVDVLRNQVATSYDNSSGYVRVQDDTSIAAYGVSSETLSAPTVESRQTARGLAEYRLRTSKDPRTRITQLIVQPRSDATRLFDAVLGLEIGDRVQITLTPMEVGDPLVQVCAIQGIGHEIDANDWFVTYYLSPAEESAESVPYLVVGDATYGEIGASAGNLVAF